MVEAPGSTTETEWMRSLGIWVSALLILESVTGLSIFLLPFSISNQVAVLVHTVAGESTGTLSAPK